jgi:acyl-CoA reductase-like NAD-dependent aldehyde dehydrogenase
VAPAIAAGCPFVLKPSDKTPVSAILLAEILAETALPPGSFSVLPTNNKDAHHFSTDERFRLVSFTGSPQVGWHIKATAGKKKVLLELGGNAGCIVDDIPEKDLKYASERCLWGSFYSQGQSCISVQV